MFGVDDIVAGAASAFGQWQANKQAEHMQDRQFAFQERMASTQWQRAAADMRAAGYNPALAYSQGPNAAPSGGGGEVPESPASAGVSSALASRQVRTNVARQMAEAQRIASQVKLNSAKEATERQRAVQIFNDAALKQTMMWRIAPFGQPNEREEALRRIFGLTVRNMESGIERNLASASSARAAGELFGVRRRLGEAELPAAGVYGSRATALYRLALEGVNSAGSLVGAVKGTGYLPYSYRPSYRR